MRLQPLGAAFFLLVSVCAVRAEEAAKPDPWQADLTRFENEDQKSSPPKDAVLFVGSSTIRMWNVQKHFPDLPAINRGFGGSQIADAVRLAPKIVVPYQPKVIVFYSGGNDLNSGKKPTEVFTDFKAFAELVETELPDAKLVYVALKPTILRAKQEPQVRETNRLIQDYLQDKPFAVYVDAYAPFLNKDGQADADLLLKDGLHLNEKGYDLLTKVVAPALHDLARQQQH